MSSKFLWGEGEHFCKNTDSWKRHVALVIRVVCVFAVGPRYLELGDDSDFCMDIYPTFGGYLFALEQLNGAWSSVLGSLCVDVWTD